MQELIFPSVADVEKKAAREIAETVQSQNDAGRPCVLLLSADTAWTGVYRELIDIHRTERLSFRNVRIFSLDQYVPMGTHEVQSQSREIRELLTNHLDIPADHVYLLDGTVPPDDAPGYCAQYEREIHRAGGVDLALPAISATGHIGFNGYGSDPDSRTRLVHIDRNRRYSLAADFFGTENVPHRAYTVGIATILQSRKILLIALGEDRAEVSAHIIEGSGPADLPARFLRDHRDLTIVMDESAAGGLKRFRTPWKIGPVEWSDTITRRAVRMLASATGKAILKLTEEDYNEGGLQELLSTRGRAYDINIRVFRHFQSTITGWPGGKPDTPNEVFPKRIVVFSPHPDDDVISMGGTLIRLADHGHEVHIAYQTSGNIAVFDEDALRYSDFVKEYCERFEIQSVQVSEIDAHVDRFLRNKEPGEVDSQYVRDIKGLIRRNEARAAARCCGVPEHRLHFQDLPFYETGRIRKKPVSSEDIERTAQLLREIQPHQIYAAGDLSDPHGTHRTCLSILLQAIRQCVDEPWYRDCVVWLYRGAWQEWPIDEIEMAVPLSPQEVERKRVAIFRHESQKDRALFPGSDTREFWQRSEARNAETARLYDRLGLAEYEAIEGFVRWDGTSGITM